jgi:hypothetical protein
LTNPESSMAFDDSRRLAVGTTIIVGLVGYCG